MALKNLHYADKRDVYGLLLRYSAHDLAFEKSEKLLDYLFDRRLFEVIANHFSLPLVSLFFQKKLFESFFPIAHQVVINKWHLANGEKYLSDFIDASLFPVPKLLELIWDFPIPLNESTATIKSSQLLKRQIKTLLKEVAKGLWQPLHRAWSRNRDEISVAINLSEGLDLSRRSSLFFLPNSGIPPRKIILYIEHPSIIRKFGGESVFNVMRDVDVQAIKLWQWFPRNRYPFFEKVQRELRNIQAQDSIDAWLLKLSLELVKDVKYWYGFFAEHCVKIHHDPTELGVTTIIKQMALEMFGGVSIGKLRSYPTHDPYFRFFYPNDIFFAWGSDGAARMLKWAELDNVLLSGLISPAKPTNHSIDTSDYFSILLLDNAFGDNESLDQLVYTPYLKRFYELFLRWLLEDQQIYVVIKPKKSYELPISADLLEKSQKTGRLQVVDDPLNKSPACYAPRKHFVISTGIFLSTALMECIAVGVKGIFYDYPNLRSVEPELYAWGKDKVIFNDMERMIVALKEYKASPSNCPNLGDWSVHLDGIDPFRDKKGSQRIGIYIRWLLEFFEKGLTRESAIEQANQLYASTWGDDKLYKSVASSVS